jgi:hypothetical protein
MHRGIIRGIPQIRLTFTLFVTGSIDGTTTYGMLPCVFVIIGGRGGWIVIIIGGKEIDLLTTVWIAATTFAGKFDTGDGRTGLTVSKTRGL